MNIAQIYSFAQRFLVRFGRFPRVVEIVTSIKQAGDERTEQAIASQVRGILQVLVQSGRIFGKNGDAIGKGFLNATTNPFCHLADDFSPSLALPVEARDISEERRERLKKARAVRAAQLRERQASKGEPENGDSGKPAEELSFDSLFTSFFA